jgi:hypothetical protein
MTSHNESWLPTTEIAIRSIERHINLNEKGLNGLNVGGSGTHPYIMQFLHVMSTVYLGTLANTISPKVAILPIPQQTLSRWR